MKTVLEFEKPVVDLEAEIDRIKALVAIGEHSRASELVKLQKKLERVRSDVYGNLTPHQRVKLSRHLGRPFSLDYVRGLCTDVVELHGDRCFGDDGALVAGIAKFRGYNVAFAGHERGRTVQERMQRNFGMPQPEGNRKAVRIFNLAEKFGLPLLLFIDTQGAYPGLEAETRGQAESIAKSLLALSSLKTPIISSVVGEGGSGGALALGICDRLLVMENSIYSVITPEGCASILWGKNQSGGISDYVGVAAEALRLTAKDLLEFGIADELVLEPDCGAHRNMQQGISSLGDALERHLGELSELSFDELLQRRYEKFRRIGDLS